MYVDLRTYVEMTHVNTNVLGIYQSLARDGHPFMNQKIGIMAYRLDVRGSTQDENGRTTESAMTIVTVQHQDEDNLSRDCAQGRDAVADQKQLVGMCRSIDVSKGLGQKCMYASPIVKAFRQTDRNEGTSAERAQGLELADLFCSRISRGCSRLVGICVRLGS